MSESNNEQSPNEVIKASMGSSFSRKSFLKYAGTTAAAAATFGMVGCDDDDPVGPEMPDMVNLGSGDIGILNYAFALEQLEAAFYIEVTNAGTFDGDDAAFMEDIRDHEIAHRQFLGAVIDSIDSDARIPALTPNFDSIDFGDRDNVLATAQVLEDTGVSAYNGAAHLISNSAAGEVYLLQAGKIVSVEARHAAAIRSMINPGTADFAADGLITDNGLDLAASPADVLAAAGGFIENDIDASGLPQPQVELRPITFG
jgi:hypothetical protein